MDKEEDERTEKGHEVLDLEGSIEVKFLEPI